MRLELILADGTVYPQNGTFYFADRQVDVRTGAIRMAGLFPNPGNTLRPGQYGRVRTAIRMQPGALLVPQRAVNELQGSYQIAVVDADNKVNIRSVKVGDAIGSEWVISEGVKPGRTRSGRRHTEGSPGNASETETVRSEVMPPCPNSLSTGRSSRSSSPS